MDKEQVETQEVEVQTDAQPETVADKLTITGTAIVFNEPSEDLGGFKEVIAPNALDGVDLSNIKFMLSHEDSKVVATTKNGSLRLTVDEKGLHYEADVDQETYDKVKDGLYDKMSFSFKEGKARMQGEFKIVEQIEKLYEISLVAIPAYDKTEARVLSRSLNKSQNGEEKNMNFTQTTEQALLEGLKSRAMTTETIGMAQEVLAPVFEKTDENTLENAVNVVKVNSGSGTIPVMAKGTVLPTAAELAEGADLDAILAPVRYEVQTHRAILPISQEAIDDAGVEIVGAIKTHLQNVKSNTVNAEIAKVLKTATTGTVADLDALRAEIIAQPTNAKVSVVMTKSMFAEISALKDAQGRYMLQPDVAKADVATLFGATVYVVEDKAFGEQGDKKAFIGDLEEIYVLERQDLDLDWYNHARFGRMLQPVLRFDVVSVGKDAKFITFGA
ncbi:phage major capsid protein [Kurthia massiliensis]|uniref:phage major capsid protein n=1 Tax=Kurthia massiliensis TaxID=1033739 RepID=UPI0002880A70|nr:phage major capsid protein [Kurthia massiliensis]